MILKSKLFQNTVGYNAVGGSFSEDEVKPNNFTQKVGDVISIGPVLFTQKQEGDVASILTAPLSRSTSRQIEKIW